MSAMPHTPRKRFGQHFLRDPGVLERMVAAIAPKPGEFMVEIGPGQGALSEPLLARLGRLHVIEIDRDLAASLSRRLGEPAGLVVHCADALKFNFGELAKGTPIRVVGNLPYNISTPLLFHLFDQASAISDMHFMLQKEVVERLAATPGSRGYGRLSVMAQTHCRIEALFAVDRQAFQPPPKVESAVLRLQPVALAPARRALLEPFEEIVRLAFGQRRKTLRNALRTRLDAGQIQAAGVDPGARAETLAPELFWALARQAVGQLHAAG